MTWYLLDAARGAPRALAVAALLAGAVLLGPLAHAAERPNLLLIVTDDQGYWDIASHGNRDIDTPAMDALAEQGVRFERFYVQPVCAPTRAGLLTGRYYLRTGLYNTRFGGDTMSAEEVTLAELLRGAGYRTGLFGKWHLGKYAGYQPGQRGFDEFLGHYHGHLEHYEFATQLVHNGTPARSRKYVADLFTDAAIEFMAADDSRPFFCMLAFNTPHSPHVLDTSHFGQPEGDRLLAKYLERGLPLREARIYAMVERIDQNLARLEGFLDVRGLSRDTVVAFMSDNGGVSRHFSAGLRGAKASVYEGGVRSPLFVRWPERFPSGGVVEAQCSHVDLLPTFCELAGAPLPADRPIDGKSLVPLLEAGRGASHHEFVYHTWDRHTPNPHQRWAISTQRYKLMAQTTRSPEEAVDQWRLYDLEQDPGEERNLIAQRPELAARLRAEFLRWFEEVTEGRTYRPMAIPVGLAEENPVELQPSWAQCEGETVQYTFAGYDWDTIDSWRTKGDRAAWRIDARRPGRYEVAISHGCPPRAAGGRLLVRVAGQSLSWTVTATPSSDVFATTVLGVVDLPLGENQLEAVAAETTEHPLMTLNAVYLRRLGE